MFPLYTSRSKPKITLDRNDDKGAANRGGPDAKLANRRKSEHLTDVGNARRVVARYGTDFRFCYQFRQFLTWDGRRWCPDETGAVVRMVKETQAELYKQIALHIAKLGGNASAKKEMDDLTKFLSHLIKWEDARRITACLEMMKSEPGVPLTPGELDSDPMLLNVVNGTLDLKTGRLREHRRGDLITKLAPVAYDPDAICPLWLTFLDRIMDGNTDLIEYLHRVVGYSLTGSVAEQVLFFFYGTGANGKSNIPRHDQRSDGRLRLSGSFGTTHGQGQRSAPHRTRRSLRAAICRHDRDGRRKAAGRGPDEAVDRRRYA